LVDINNIKSTLKSVTVGDSGAKNVSVSPIVGSSAVTVQAILEDAVIQGTNFTGTWQGYSPVATDPGIQSVVNEHTAQLADKVNLGNSLPVIGSQPTTIAYPGLIGMDSLGNIFRAGTLLNLQRSNDGETWETIHTFNRNPNGVRQLDNGELLVGIADNYPTNTIKSALWISSGYPSVNATWSKVLDADDYQQSLGLSWGFGGAGNKYVVSEYDSKAANVRSANQKVWLTQDSGLTWTTIYNHGTGALSNRHVHGCCYDQYSGAIWVTVGDYSIPDPTARGIIVSWDLGVTWTVVTNQHQPTAIYAFPDCVIFGTDNAPNGILRINNPSPSSLVVDSAYKLNLSKSISHVAERPFRLGDGLLVIPFTTSVLDNGYVLATYDGWSWFELWQDTRSYNGYGATSVFGPMASGKYMITGRELNGYFSVTIDDIKTSLISAISNASKLLNNQTPKRAYIAVANSSTPYTVVGTSWTRIILSTSPFKLYDTSDLFSIEADGRGIKVKRDCIVNVDADTVAANSFVNPWARIVVNDVSVGASYYQTIINKTLMLNANDVIGLEAWEGVGGKSVLGSSYCLVLDTWETY